MKAAYWTQFGAMAIPLGVSLIVAFPDLRVLGFWIIIAGFIFSIAGWYYTIKSERENDVKNAEARKDSELDRVVRKREHFENLAMLAALADQRGLSTVRLRRLIERLEQEGKERDKV